MKKECLDLERILYFCRHSQMLVGGRTHGGREFWVSPMGPHSSDLTYEQVETALEEMPAFQLREMTFCERDTDVTYFVTRQELEEEIRQLLPSDLRFGC